ncbi:SRPBCC family protein [Promicromonospora sp. Marseille-Q5078]
MTRPGEAISGRRRLLMSVSALGLGAHVLHIHRHWGASDGEIMERLPGDGLVPEPAESTTLGITVAAPATTIWSWLVQIGQDRGGMYSYDWAENLLGLDIHSTDQVRPQWQQLSPGDRLVVVPEGYAGMPSGYAFTVARVDPPRTLVLRQSPPEHPWNGVWSFHVISRPDGSCRLLSRARTEIPDSPALRFATRLGEPVTLVMTRRMLRGIRLRAERASLRAVRSVLTKQSAVLPVITR